MALPTSAVPHSPPAAAVATLLPWHSPITRCLILILQHGCAPWLQGGVQVLCRAEYAGGMRHARAAAIHSKGAVSWVSCPCLTYVIWLAWHLPSAPASCCKPLHVCGLVLLSLPALVVCQCKQKGMPLKAPFGKPCNRCPGGAACVWGGKGERGSLVVGSRQPWAAAPTPFAGVGLCCRSGWAGALLEINMPHTAGLGLGCMQGLYGWWHCQECTRPS